MRLIEAGHRVAVLAVDPSSPITVEASWVIRHGCNNYPRTQRHLYVLHPRLEWGWITVNPGDDVALYSGLRRDYC